MEFELIVLILKTHFDPTDFRPVGMSTNFQVSLFSMNCNSLYMAERYSSCSALAIASVKVFGCASSWFPAHRDIRFDAIPLVNLGDIRGVCMANASETAPITLSSGTIASAISNSFSLGLSSVFMMLPTTEVSSNLTYLLKGSR